jgi:hypothetical protein
MGYHVCIGLESVPLYAWNLHTITRVLGSSCSIDYIEARSVRKESTDLLWVWAYTEDPGFIPKVKQLTLPARSSQAAGSRVRGHRGLRHRVLINLTIVEDFTTEDANGNPPPPYPLPFRLGAVDDEAIGDRRRGSPQRHGDRRGMCDDDDDRGGRDAHHRSRSWGNALRRSLSKAPRENMGDGR